MNDTLKKNVICLFLILATFCVYSQVKDHEFINFDDIHPVPANTSKNDLIQEKAIFVFAELTGFNGIHYLEKVSTVGEKSESEKKRKY